MRVLVTGSRTWDAPDAIRLAFWPIWLEHKQDVTLVSGACPNGADAMAEEIAQILGWTIERHPADWTNLGKRAGYVRNAEMVRAGADICLAFIRDESRGASMTARLAIQAGIETTIYRSGSG